MAKITVVIPNYNGLHFLKPCLESLKKQSLFSDLEVLVVDNGSKDGSQEFVREECPWATVLGWEDNRGFCQAVNEGIKRAGGEYVFLLNNDTTLDDHCCEHLLKTMQGEERVFSVAAKMLQAACPDKIDDAGNYYTALGWAFARGKGRDASSYSKPSPIFAACAGAALYRRKIFDEIGFFDEKHFAYLEDVDVGYRSLIYGYQNLYQPKALVYHVGSGTSGSRYNSFKVGYSARNNIYLLYKNMPLLQLLLNLPFLMAGFALKYAFFLRKGMGADYRRGLKEGILLSLKNRKKKVRFTPKRLKNYAYIQWQLWINIFRKMKK